MTVSILKSGTMLLFISDCVRLAVIGRKLPNRRQRMINMMRMMFFVASAACMQHPRTLVDNISK
jgi:hypothetical protein